MNEYKMNDEEVRRRRYLRQIYFGEAMLAGGETGLTFERGIWTPEADVNDAYIYFNDQHDDAPFYYCIYTASDTYSDEEQTHYIASVFSFYNLDKTRVWESPSLVLHGIARVIFRATNLNSLSSSFVDIVPEQLSKYLKPDSIYAVPTANFRYWRADIEYKWIAVWAPEE